MHMFKIPKHNYYLTPMNYVVYFLGPTYYLSII